MGYPILHSMQVYFRLMLEEVVVVVIVSLEITGVDQEEEKEEEEDLQIYPILASLQEWTGHHVIRDEKIISLSLCIIIFYQHNTCMRTFTCSYRQLNSKVKN